MSDPTKYLKQAFTYAALIAAAIIMVGPFLWMLVASLTPVQELYTYPPKLPSRPAFENYADVFARFPFALFTLNSVKIAVLATLGTLVSASLAAYAFARFEFRFKGVVYWIILATMMVPFQVTMIPVFWLFKVLGLTGSHAALILPSFFGFGMGAFGVFLLRQFFQSVPREMEEAAIMDGASRFRIYWQIMLPMARPALATLAVLTFMAHWNDLLGPVLYLQGREQMTLTYGLAELQGGDLASRVDLSSAGAMLSIIPIILVFLVAQKLFVGGIGVGAVKE